MDDECLDGGGGSTCPDVAQKESFRGIQLPIFEGFGYSIFNRSATSLGELSYHLSFEVRLRKQQTPTPPGFARKDGRLRRTLYRERTVPKPMPAQTVLQTQQRVLMCSDRRKGKLKSGFVTQADALRTGSEVEDMCMCDT